MIECEIWQNDKVICHRYFHDSMHSLEVVVKKMELYIVNEKLNEIGECLLRARFCNGMSDEIREPNLDDYKKYFISLKGV